MKNFLKLILVACVSTGDLTAQEESRKWGDLFKVKDKLPGTAGLFFPNEEIEPSPSINELNLASAIRRDNSFYKRNVKYYRESFDPRFDTSPEKALSEAKELILNKSRQLLRLTKIDHMEHGAILGVNEKGEYIMSNIVTSGNAKYVQLWDVELPEGYKKVGFLHSHPSHTLRNLSYLTKSDPDPSKEEYASVPETALSQLDIKLGYVGNQLAVAIPLDGNVYTYSPPDNPTYSADSPLPLTSYSNKGIFGILGNVSKH